jgi:hypothetical protein
MVGCDGWIVMPERVVFDHRPPLNGRVQSLRGMPLVSLFTRLTATLSFVQPAVNQAFPPTHPRRGVGQKGKLPVRSSYLSFHPCRATKYKSDLPSFPIVGRGSIVFCYVRNQGLSAGRRPAARGGRRMGGRATAYRGGKQSYRSVSHPCREISSVHCKKRLTIFTSPAGMLLVSKLYLAGNNVIILGPGSLVSDIPVGDGNIANHFLQCRLSRGSKGESVI